jgi:hypothetical protein
VAFYVGLDLGRENDYTALAIIQKPPKESSLHLRHLERYPLGTSYPAAVDKVKALLSDARLSSADLVVDKTGVGVAVADIFSKASIEYIGVTITGGENINTGGDGWRVPKRDLVAALEVPFHSGRLKVAEGLYLWPTLKKELLNFRRKINKKTAHDSYEHWRASDHDDLVLAAALACWWARRSQAKPAKALGP